MVLAAVLKTTLLLRGEWVVGAEGCCRALVTPPAEMSMPEPEFSSTRCCFRAFFSLFRAIVMRMSSSLEMLRIASSSATEDLAAITACTALDTGGAALALAVLVMLPTESAGSGARRAADGGRALRLPRLLALLLLLLLLSSVLTLAM